MSDLKQLWYSQRHKRHKRHATLVQSKPRTPGIIRIATFNVHYFCDIMNNSAVQGILKDIAKIDADIIILQEALLGTKFVPEPGKKQVNVENILMKLKNAGYTKNIMCNTVPSWYNAPYGNLMLIHDRVSNQCKDEHICFRNHETISKMWDPKKGSETRCYIYLNFNGIHIYGTHFDVYDKTGKTRLHQLKDILDDIKHKKIQQAVIMGDFNDIDITQYSVEDKQRIRDMYASQGMHISKGIKNALTRAGFTDSFGSCSPPKMPPTVTVWNNTRIDFIYVKNVDVKDTFVYETYNSDHFPIVADISIKV